MKTRSPETDNDREILISIVKEMASSMSGAQSTKHWADDALWFDIPAFASRGIPPALAMFDSVFSTFTSCEADILETDVVIGANMGVVCTVQKVSFVTRLGEARSIMARQTDCFEKRDDDWKLFHQHISVPTGASWDGKIITSQIL